MSADTQILITLREYCRALEQREAILLRDPPEDPQEYQQQLARINGYTRTLNRHQLVLRAWARREDPIMTALQQDRDEDVASFSQQLDAWKNKRAGVVGGRMSAAMYQQQQMLSGFANTTWTNQYAQTQQAYTQAQQQANPYTTSRGKPTP